MTSEWITGLADDERKRDAVRSGELQAASRRANLVLRHGRVLLDELQQTMRRDVESFRREFPGDSARDVQVESESEGGFVASKAGHPAVSLTVTPSWNAGTVNCRYRFTSNSGMPAREDRFDLVLAHEGEDAARFKHEGSARVFATADGLSEFLLTPVFTGRPR